MVQVTPELVMSLLKKYAVDEDVSSSVIADIQRINRINVERSKLAREREQEIVRHEAILADLGRRYAELVASCHHPETTYQADPSGGGESSRTCDLCGGEV